MNPTAPAAKRRKVVGSGTVAGFIVTVASKK
jgi:hypothetical protein